MDDEISDKEVESMGETRCPHCNESLDLSSFGDGDPSKPEIKLRCSTCNEHFIFNLTEHSCYNLPESRASEILWQITFTIIIIAVLFLWFGGGYLIADLLGIESKSTYNYYEDDDCRWEWHPYGHEVCE